MKQCTVLAMVSVLSLAAGAAAQTPAEKTATEAKLAGSAVKTAGKEVGDAVVNELSADEAKEGWTLLFNGRSLEGWRGYKTEQPPPGWSVQDGVLVRTSQGGDLMTMQPYGDFVLDLDFKIAEGGNSGIMYRVTTDGEQPYWSGPEYQILDNERHRDAKNGPDRLTGANYDLIAPSKDASKPAGEWNNARIAVTGNHVEHWLNGEKVVEYDFGSPEWTTLVAESKFKAWPSYGKASRGHIVLQDHGDRVEFRNIKIKATN